MSKLKVVVTDYVFENFNSEEKILGEIGAELRVFQCKNPQELKEKVKDADAILNTYLSPLDREIFKHAPDLKIIVRYGIGVDTINIKDATEFGIMVANVPDYCVEEVADHAMALFLALARKIVISDKNVKKGNWSLSYLKPLKGISEMTAGIVGFGRIGKAIAGRLTPFGLKILFFDPYLKESTITGNKKVDFDTLVETADVIFIQCPATDSTYHLFNREVFSKMKKSPLVINTARGKILDTDSLIWALENGLISGAALDVIEDESRVQEKDFPLKSYDNVILTPHSAWYSENSIRKLQQKAAEEVVRGLTGKRPRSLINPEVLERRNA